MQLKIRNALWEMLRRVFMCYYHDMKLLWTWGGKFFGYQNLDDLWSYSGKHIGKFYDDEIYDPSGRYLGEIKNENRLIRNISKSGKCRGSFSRKSDRGGIVQYIGYVGYVMYLGYDDFAAPEDF